jgi:hypothetical protein
VGGLTTALSAWIDDAAAKLEAGELSRRDLEALRTLAAAPPRQRLLYLHAREPSVRSEVIGWAEHPGEDPGGLPQERPYPTVLAALEDGWRAIHFPQQLAPFDDRELDVVGYEFILEKTEKMEQP